MFLVKEEPLYLKLKNNLKELIENQNLTVLPGTKDLEKSYGVSRITARRAIAELAKEGIVSSAQGRKVMVTKHMYSEVKELGFVISQPSPWCESIFSYFVNESLKNNYNLNMFICSISKSIASNNIFSYLLESNKLSGLLMMNRLSDKDLQWLQKKQLPLLTYNYKYINNDIPAVMFDYEPAISQMLSHYLDQNIKRFAFICFHEEEGDPAYGEGHGFINAYKKFIKTHKLHDYDIPGILKHDTDRASLTYKAMCHLHSLPEAQRPQIIATCFYTEYSAAKLYFKKVNNWKPLLVPCREISNKQPYFYCSYKEMAKISFNIFASKLKESGELKEDILIPTSFAEK